MDPLLGLESADLTHLAGLLRTGRLVIPLAAEQLARWFPESVTAPVARALNALCAAGFTGAQQAMLLESLVADRQRRPPASASVELVATSPLEGEPGLPRPTSAVVQSMFASAERTVDIVGYAIHQGREMFRVLADRMREIPDLRVRMFLNVQREPKQKDDPAAQVLAEFVAEFFAEKWPAGARPPDLYYDPRALEIEAHERACLHAKCVIVDERAIFVSSANFTEAAHERNIEVGVRLALPEIAARMAAFLNRLVNAEVLVRLN